MLDGDPNKLLTLAYKNCPPFICGFLPSHQVYGEGSSMVIVASLWGTCMLIFQNPNSDICWTFRVLISMCYKKAWREKLLPSYPQIYI